MRSLFLHQTEHPAEALAIHLHEVDATSDIGKVKLFGETAFLLVPGFGVHRDPCHAHDPDTQAGILANFALEGEAAKVGIGVDGEVECGGGGGRGGLLCWAIDIVQKKILLILAPIRINCHYLECVHASRGTPGD